MCAILPRMCRGNPVLWPTMSRVLAALLLTLLTATCQATGDRPSVRLYQDYPGTEIEHLGSYDDPRYSDYGYIALLNGFGYLVRRGVDKAAIKKASVQEIRRLGLVHLPQPPYYDLWVEIEGCPRRVHMKTSFTGRLFTVQDKGGCVKGAGS